ncbi:hypothetical protein BU15DRAFT_66122 [Melanogaster broomeanus]|nr:hypothetical protein BU15DRAFT_66122 [Melanogaster broomeanus]
MSSTRPPEIQPPFIVGITVVFAIFPDYLNIGMVATYGHGTRISDSGDAFVQHHRVDPRQPPAAVPQIANPEDPVQLLQGLTTVLAGLSPIPTVKPHSARNVHRLTGLGIICHLTFDPRAWMQYINQSAHYFLFICSSAVTLLTLCTRYILDHGSGIIIISIGLIALPVVVLALQTHQLSEKPQGTYRMTEEGEDWARAKGDIGHKYPNYEHTCTSVVEVSKDALGFSVNGPASILDVSRQRKSSKSRHYEKGSTSDVLQAFTDADKLLPHRILLICHLLSRGIVRWSYRNVTHPAGNHIPIYREFRRDRELEMN